VGRLLPDLRAQDQLDLAAAIAGRGHDHNPLHRTHLGGCHPRGRRAVTDWPPWLHEVMDIAVPVLFLILVVLMFHLSVRARTRNPEGESGLILLAAVGRAVAWSNSALVSLWIVRVLRP
jgi:hypothetical protein